MTTELNKSPPMNDADRAAHWEKVARRYHELFVKSSREKAANRLQNAELLEALEALYRAAGTPVHADERRAQELARAAIVKARGQH